MSRETAHTFQIRKNSQKKKQGLQATGKAARFPKGQNNNESYSTVSGKKIEAKRKYLEKALFVVFMS
jgi:hypothetical protein